MIRTRTTVSRRRAASYVFFLATAMLVTTIGLSALAVARVKLRAAEGGNDSAAARLYAQSAIEFALLAIDTDAGWRDAITHDAWQATQPIGDGSFTWKLADELNASLATDRNALVRVYGKGVCGDSVWVYSVLVQPPPEVRPVELLVNGDLETNAVAPWWTLGDCDLETRSETDDHHSGNYGLKVKGRDTMQAGPRQTVTVQEWQSYRGDMWVRMRDTTDDVLFLLGIETALGWDWFTLAEVQVDEEWTRLSGTVTPTWSGTLISAVVKVETVFTDKDILLDDVSFMQVPSTVGPISGTWQRESQ